MKIIEKILYSLCLFSISLFPMENKRTIKESDSGVIAIKVDTESGVTGPSKVKKLRPEHESLFCFNLASQTQLVSQPQGRTKLGRFAKKVKKSTNSRLSQSSQLPMNPEEEVIINVPAIKSLLETYSSSCNSSEENDTHPRNSFSNFDECFGNYEQILKEYTHQ